ncbi:BLUF domain-containing protein [Mucilaginibacter sp. UR6-1]|uniref:BLUF domain-containing protein n=1 Tax=Mucilaginibacter sp. UR6-1 TaxID=1435643 RepID=UPI001E60C478|nr:BLUF domain-containing protein [Mucilaginibacter sp. UR6-1]MCC8409966.1 BLUF domain-containing protein [Mucilaginibacter sp. UR6-1]
MFNIIYLSTATTLLNDFELAEILSISRDNNVAKQLTGMLLYADGTFMQVLEGEKEEVMRTYHKILLDERHKNVIELAAGPLDTRNFPEWSMGFASVNADVLEEFEGYVDPQSKGFLNNEKVNAAIIMLKGFAENNKMN